METKTKIIGNGPMAYRVGRVDRVPKKENMRGGLICFLNSFPSNGIALGFKNDRHKLR